MFDGCLKSYFSLFFSDMPRYHVKDMQESNDVKSVSSTGSKSSTDISGSGSSGSHGASDSSTTNGGSGNNVTGFRPHYLPNSTQACHCSACVGAVAANVHPVRGRRGRERERGREGERERGREREREGGRESMCQCFI